MFSGFGGSNVVGILVKADTKDAEAGISKMSTLMKGGLAVAAGVALNSVKDFVVGSLASFSDLNESLNALDVTYGENAEGIKKLGEEAATSLGLSNAEFNGYAVSLGAFVEKIAGDTGDVVGTMGTLTTRVSDFASVMNLDVGEAMEKFRSGLSGESEPLRKFGIDVSAANVKAFALANGIGEVGRELTEGEKVQARYGTIMEQTAKTAGDFANTSDDVANKQRIVNAELENSKALLGQALVPLQQAWLDVQQDAIPILTDLADVLGFITSGLGENEEAVEGSTEKWSIAGAVWGALPFQDMIDLLGKTADATRDSEEAIEAQTESAKKMDWRKQFQDLTTNTGGYEDLTGAIEDTEEAQEDLNIEIQTGTELMRDAFDEMRGQTDATFALKNAKQGQADAQAAVNAAVEEFGARSPEHLTALEELAGASLDLRDAEIRLVEQGAPTRDEFVHQQISLGLTRAEAELLATAYDELFTPRTVTHTIKFDQPTGANPGRVPGRAKGGHQSAHEVGVVGEEGPELWVPDTGGTVVPLNGKTTAAGGGVNITVNGFVGSELALAAEIDRLLTRRAKYSALGFA
jgi:hypothetical protein